MKNLLFILVVCCLGCGVEPNVETEEILRRINNNDTLFIEARFSDCGEWGGHHEHYRLFNNEKRGLIFSGTRDTVNCGDPEKFNRRIIEEYKFMHVSEDDLIIFLNEMNISKDEELMYSVVTEDYKVFIKTDSNETQYHIEPRSDWNAFIKFRKKLH